jgi:tetratricopeptide (TPR) repeat protein
MSLLDERLRQIDGRSAPRAGVRAMGAWRIPGERPRRLAVLPVALALVGLVAATVAVVTLAGGGRLHAGAPAGPVNAGPPPVPRPAAPSAAALVARGKEAASLGLLDRARSLFEQALGLAPDDAEAWNGLGVVLVRAGDLAGGTRALRRALQSNPRHADSHRNLAVALERQGKSAEALAHYRSFAALAPKPHAGHAEVEQRLAALTARMGER